MQKSTLPLLTLLLCTSCFQPDLADDERPVGERKISNVRLDGDFVVQEMIGDLWPATWADDDNVYTMFGDGTGRGSCHIAEEVSGEAFITQYFIEETPGCWALRDKPTPEEERDNPYCSTSFLDCQACYPEFCPITTLGAIKLEGEVPRFKPCPPQGCLTSLYVPYDDPNIFDPPNSVKPSSLLYLNNRLYAHLHRPTLKPTEGFIAYSDDYGQSWQTVEGSPWDAASKMPILLFVQMGKNYEENRDGYVYAVGMQAEVIDKLDSNDIDDYQQVYLTRVPVPTPSHDTLLDFSAYEYFAGLDSAHNAMWSRDLTAARPLDGVHTKVQMAAAFHPGLDRYLLISGLDHVPDGAGPFWGTPRHGVLGMLYEAPDPWGPWTEAGSFPGGYVASIFSKGMGERSFYFAAAADELGYNLNLAELVVELEP